MSGRRRWHPAGTALAVVLVGVLLWAGWVGWTAWAVRGDLAQARDDAADLRTAIASDDLRAAGTAGQALETASASAVRRTDGPSWWLASRLPWVGDDAAAVRSLSRSLHVLATDGVVPLIRSSRTASGLSTGEGLDLAAVRRLRPFVASARDAARAAADEVADVDPDGLLGVLRGPYEEYADGVTALADGLGAAETATELLPPMAGGDGVRHYLVLVQNNAEIRSTGGLPGAYLVVRADGGRLEIVRQGGPRDFEGPLPEPVLPLTPSERTIFGEQLGTYVGDVGFTPDFPRSAELAAAHWSREDDLPLDGVVAVDPVALGYLVPSLPPVEVDGTTLTRASLTDDLLSAPYRTLEPVAQDELFERTARQVFGALLRGPTSVVGALEGLVRAGREGRLLVAPFDEAEAQALAGTRVAGEAGAGDGAGRSPRVDVTLDDATGSKMSYYLRYDTDVVSEACSDGVQRLAGALRLRSDLPVEEARTLPVSVTGGGAFGTEVGAQLVVVRILGPYGGSIERVRLDDEEAGGAPVDLGGRPVVTVPVLLDGERPVDLAWQMRAREGQTGDVDVRVTPGVVPGDEGLTVPSSCDAGP